MFLMFNIYVGNIITMSKLWSSTKVTTACHSDLANVSPSHHLYFYITCWIINLTKVLIDGIIA